MTKDEVLKWNEEHKKKQEEMDRKGIQYARPAHIKSNITEPHLRIANTFFEEDMTDKRITSNPLGLYLFLRRYTWTRYHPKDIHNLYYKYYLHGILASTYSMRELARVFGRSLSTIDDWISLLIDKGWMMPGDKVGPEGQNTYILGTIDDEGNQRYFADGV